MKGTLAMACTEGGLYQHNWKEQSSIPALERLFMVREKTSFFIHSTCCYIAHEQCSPPTLNQLHAHYSFSLFKKLTPMEGTLRPYQTERIDVLFSPTLDQSDKGWEHHQGMASRRDYSLYVHVIPVGLTKQGYEQEGMHAHV